MLDDVFDFVFSVSALDHFLDDVGGSLMGGGVGGKEDGEGVEESGRVEVIVCEA